MVSVMVTPKAETLPVSVRVPLFRTKQQVSQQTFVLGISGKTLASRNIAIGASRATVRTCVSSASGTIVSSEVVKVLTLNSLVTLHISYFIVFISL